MPGRLQLPLRLGSRDLRVKPLCAREEPLLLEAAGVVEVPVERREDLGADRARSFGEADGVVATDDLSRQRVADGAKLRPGVRLAGPRGVARGVDPPSREEGPRQPDVRPLVEVVLDLERERRDESGRHGRMKREDHLPDRVEVERDRVVDPRDARARLELRPAEGVGGADLALPLPQLVPGRLQRLVGGADALLRLGEREVTPRGAVSGQADDQDGRDARRLVCEEAGEPGTPRQERNSSSEAIGRREAPSPRQPGIIRGPASVRARRGRLDWGGARGCRCRGERPGDERRGVSGRRLP